MGDKRCCPPRLYLETMSSSPAGRRISLTYDCVVNVSFLLLSGPGADCSSLLNATARTMRVHLKWEQIEMCFVRLNGREESRCFLFTSPPCH